MLAPSVPIERATVSTDTGKGASAIPQTSRAARADVRDALEHAFDASAPMLYRFFVVRTGNTHVSDDLMQQLWLAADANGRDVPAGQIEFWLRGVARNLLGSHWRRAKRAGLAADPELARAIADRLESGREIQEMLEQREALDQLMLALTELSAEEHDLIVMRYFQRADLGTIAAKLNASERAVEGRLYRARQSLRERLKQLE